MSKEHKQSKDVKKKPQLTPKEKKANKKLKKHAGDTAPLIVPRS
jgi:hypothetical protein